MVVDDHFKLGFERTQVCIRRQLQEHRHIGIGELRACADNPDEKELLLFLRQRIDAESLVVINPPLFPDPAQNARDCPALVDVADLHPFAQCQDNLGDVQGFSVVKSLAQVAAGTLLQK